MASGAMARESPAVCVRCAARPLTTPLGQTGPVTPSYNLADLFEGAAEALAGQDAVVAGGADVATVRRSYAELDRRVDRVANLLAGQGIGPGDHVGLHAHNSAEFVEVMLAAFKLRAVPVNANYRYTTEELAYVFADARVAAVVSESGIDDRARAAAPDVPLTVIGDDYEEAVAAADSTPVDVGPRSGDDHYLMYTGGTTGMPKGVVWRHEDLFFAALGGTGAPRHGQDPLDDPTDIARFVTIGTGITRRLPLCPLIHGGAQWIALNRAAHRGHGAAHRRPTLRRGVGAALRGR